jgi:cytochrome c oxidase subunit 2
MKGLGSVGMNRRSLVITIVAALVAIVAGIVLSYVIDWFPVAASTLVIASVPIFVLVVTVILYCAWRFRMKPGQELEDGPPIHGHTGLEVLWTAVPAALVIGLVSYSFVVLHENEHRPKGSEIVVGVTGRQFQWSFEYPRSATGGAPVTSYELYLPVGEPVLFKIHSMDVIHGFWVPAFRVQIDAVPGITTTLRATPVRVGAYPVVCSVLCGAGHSLMRTTAHVLRPAAFRSWLASQAGSSGASAGAPPGGAAGAPSGGAASGSPSAAGEGAVGEGGSGE